MNTADDAYAATLAAREDILPAVVNGAVNKLMLKVKEQAKLGSFQATLQIEFDNPVDVVKSARAPICTAMMDRGFFVRDEFIPPAPWDGQETKPTVTFIVGWQKEQA